MWWPKYWSFSFNIRPINEHPGLISFRYDLNQIPYNYTIEVRNRFKGLDLIHRVPDELWMEVHDIVQETDQEDPQEKEMQKGKMVA